MLPNTTKSRISHFSHDQRGGSVERSVARLSASGFGWRVVGGDWTVQHGVLPVPLPGLLPPVEEAADADQNHHDDHTDNDDDEANTHLRKIYISFLFYLFFPLSFLTVWVCIFSFLIANSNETVLVVSLVIIETS